MRHDKIHKAGKEHVYTNIWLPEHLSWNYETLGITESQGKEEHIYTNI